MLLIREVMESPREPWRPLTRESAPLPSSHVIIWVSLGTGHPPGSPGISEALPKLRTTTGEQAQDRALGPRKLRPSSFKNLGSELSLWLAPTPSLEWGQIRGHVHSRYKWRLTISTSQPGRRQDQTVCVRYLLPGGQICPPQGILLRKLGN